MSDDRPCDCVDVGALNYVDEFDPDADELDLVLDEPDDIEALADLTGGDVGGFELVGDDPIDPDGDELGFLDTAIDLGFKLGKKVVDVVSAPSKSKAKQARRKASAAQQKASALEAELRQAKARDEKEKRQQAVMEQRRREQTHAREKRELEAQLKDLEQQKMLVQREVGKKALELRKSQEQAATAEKERKSRNFKLAVGGGVAGASLLALWAINRRPKTRDDDKETRR